MRETIVDMLESPSKRAPKYYKKIGALLVTISLMLTSSTAAESGKIYRFKGKEYLSTPITEQRELELLSANTHNRPLVQFFNGSFQEANPTQILAENNPDVACFQEISEEDALNLSYYGDVVFTSNSDAPLNGSVGIAIVSRRKIENVDFINPDDNNRPAIIANIDNLKIACLHLTANKAIAKNQLRKIMEIISNLDLIMGDLNLRPEEANQIIGAFKYSSPEYDPSLLSDIKTDKKGAVDRIIVLGSSELPINSATGYLISIHSDHLGVKVVLIMHSS